MIIYTKPYLSIQDQLNLLVSRGMLVTDQQRAIDYLARVGYYRLSGYWYPLRKSVTTNNGQTIETKILDQFRDGVEFKHVVDLYVFDKLLRMIFLDAIERIEVAFRVDIATLLGKKGALAHRDTAQLHGNFAKKVCQQTGKTQHQEWLNKLDTAFSKSQEEFARHFKQNYSSHLPIWIAIELFDFGMLSKFIAGMTIDDRTEIAKKHGISRAELLVSWMRSINHIRNICAHHGRLWNRTLSDQPKPPRHGDIPDLDHVVGNTFCQSKIYCVAAIIKFLLMGINPSSSWGSRLRSHLEQFPIAPGISIDQTGFFPGFERHRLWL